VSISTPSTFSDTVKIGNVDIPIIAIKKSSRPQRFTAPASIYLTPTERDDLKARANARHQTISHCARLAMKRGFKRAPSVTSEEVAVPALEEALVKLRAVRLGLRPRAKTGLAIDNAIALLGRAQAALKQTGAIK